MAMTIVLALAVGFLIAVGRARTADTLRTGDFVASAQTAMSQGGADQLERWIVFERHTHPELQMYFVGQNGQELLSRTVSGRALADPRGGAPPLVRDRTGRSYLMIVRRTQNFAYILNDFLQPQMLVVVAVLVSGIGCAWMARYLTRPLKRLGNGIGEIVSGNLGAGMGKALTQRRDEFGGLARDFDAMTVAIRDLIASKEDLLRDISHELRSPLARLRIAAGLARKDATRAQQGEFDRIDREVERLDAMIGQILRFSRLNEKSSLKMEEIDLTTLLDEAIEDARIEGAAAHSDITINQAGPVLVRGDRDSLRSAVENVLRNAVRFSPPDSVTEVGLKVQDGNVFVSVADSGPGVDPALLTRLFDPFFRGDPSNGVGLGLAIAKRAMDFNGGAISAANTPAGGLQVVMRLPVASRRPD
jgi:signal transduction histidine kinase